MDWIGSALIVWGFWKITDGVRWGYYPYVIGELVYTVYAWQIESWGLLALCLIFAGLGVRGWLRHAKTS